MSLIDIQFNIWGLKSSDDIKADVDRYFAHLNQEMTIVSDRACARLRRELFRESKGYRRHVRRIKSAARRSGR